MSKAFTKETDDAPDDDLPNPPASASLPPGTRNYLTANGAARLRAELAESTQGPSSVEAAPGDLSAEDLAQRRKRKRRQVEIEQILQTAEVVPPPVGADASNAVVFGTTVTVREVRSGEESRYQIVGVDELDWGEDRVSLHAPIARALLKAQVGDRVRFRFPAGEELLEIVAVNYD